MNGDVREICLCHKCEEDAELKVLNHRLAISSESQY